MRISILLLILCTFSGASLASNGTENNQTFFSIILYAKHTADSILISNYGQKFYDEHIIWRIEESFFEDVNGENHFFDYVLQKISLNVSKPKLFMLHYDVQFETKTCSYPIQLLMNSEFQLIDRYSWGLNEFSYNVGLEKLESNGNDSLQIMTSNEAYLAAKAYGFKPKKLEIENEVALIWERDDEQKEHPHNGNWKIYVVKYLKDDSNSIDSKKSDKKCQVYKFNPWTKEFLGKQKMIFNEEHPCYFHLFDSPPPNGFKYIFGSNNSIPPVSYDSLSFFRLRSKNEKRLLGTWVSEKKDTLMLNANKITCYHLIGPDATPIAVYWHSFRKKIRFFEKENDRIESEEYRYFNYRIRNGNLYVYVDKITDTKRKKDREITLYRRI